jgi:aspartokinase-like uncharacterized kinase
MPPPFDASGACPPTSVVSRRVVKIGGSLLDWADLATHLRAWFDHQPPAQWLAIVGGGRLADALRDAHRTHGLTDELSHWLCARAMAIHAEMLASLLPGARWPASLDELSQAEIAPGLWFVDPVRFLARDDALSPRPLPASWDVTSDSIAARLAARAGAVECVLFKSALPPKGATIAEASAQGFVDPHFPVACGPAMPVRCVNLRDPAHAETTLRRSGGDPGQRPGNRREMRFPSC